VIYFEASLSMTWAILVQFKHASNFIVVTGTYTHTVWVGSEVDVLPYDEPHHNLHSSSAVLLLRNGTISKFIGNKNCAG